MIVPMKKASVIVQTKDVEVAVLDLRRLGILHIEHQVFPQSKNINILREEFTLLNNTLQIFSVVKSKENSVKLQEGVLGKVTGDWQSSARHVIELWKRYEQLEAYFQTLKQIISQWEPWGDFEPLEIEELQQKNIFIKLYKIPQTSYSKIFGKRAKEISGFPDRAVVRHIFSRFGMAYYVVIAQQPFSNLLYKEIPLPKQSLSVMRKKLIEDKQVMDSIRVEIRKISVLSEEFMRIKEKLEKEIELQESLAGMGKEGRFSFINGYLPFDKSQALLEEARIRQWAVVITEPSEQDNVPTLIRNPGWISLVRPIFRLLEILPGYRELDISLFFLIFFCLFFGILIGDAGYGAIYLALTFWAEKKFGNRIKDRSYFFFFYILSFCAIIWGFLIGSIFGQEWLAKIGFRPILPALTATKNIQTFCFFIGALHLSFAHLWRLILKLPRVCCLAELGWVFVLWSAFFFARMLILADPLLACVKWMLIVGIILVVFFCHPQKNILKTIAKGLGTLAISLMNNFTDVVSYVRLFAVGLAGVAIADTFNNIVASLGRDNILTILAGCFILLVGHGLNLVLGPMSVLVHGVRLNILEFSGHANVSWKGFPYNPLKE